MATGLAPRGGPGHAPANPQGDAGLFDRPQDYHPTGGFRTCLLQASLPHASWSKAVTAESGARTDMATGPLHESFGTGERGVLAPSLAPVPGGLLAERIRRRRNRTFGNIMALRSPGHPEINDRAMEAKEPNQRTETATTVMRAVEMLELIAQGRIALPDLVSRLGNFKTSTYRIATTLVDAGLLEASGRSGYRIGRRLSELGSAYRGD